MVPDTRIRLAQILQAVTLLWVAGCYGCDDDDNGGPPEPPPQTDAPIASVEIIPSRISVQKGTSFIMRARVKDEWGNILPDYRASGVRWKPSGELTVSGSPSSRVTVTVTPTSPLPLNLEVVASVDGVEKTDTSIVSVTGAPEANDRDWIRSDYAANTLPSFALLTGHSNYGEPGERTNAPVAFVQEGGLENFDCNSGPTRCGVVTIFAPGRALTQANVQWTGSCDFVGFVSVGGVPTGCAAVSPTIATPLQSPPVIPVAVWRLVDAPGIENQIKADIAYAQSVFDQPHIGLKLDFQIRPYPGKHLPITHGVGCTITDGTPLTTELAKSGIKYDPKTITVVFVEAINPGIGDDIGFTCPYDDAGTGSLIIVSADAITSSTLAHELGHALGEWQSGDRAHPDVPAPRLPGFDPSNLMWSSESDWGVALRRNLTLGQLFQMSFADISFLKKSKISATPGLSCPPDAASNSPCPRLAEDQR